MAALQRHLPTFNDTAGHGAFSEDALRRALGPALTGKLSPAQGQQLAPEERFTPLSVDSWAKPARSDTVDPPPRHGTAQPAAGLASLIPQMGAVSQKQAEAAKIAAAVTKAQAEAADAHAEALEAVRQAEREQAAGALDAARAAWATEEAERLHEALKGVRNEILATIGDAVETVLRPVFDQACVARAMKSFVAAMEPLLSDGAPQLLEVHAPADLAEALERRFRSASHVTVVRSDEPSLRAVADITLVEASLREWITALPSLPLKPVPDAISEPVTDTTPAQASGPVVALAGGGESHPDEHAETDQDETLSGSETAHLAPADALADHAAAPFPPDGTPEGERSDGDR